MSEWFGEPPQKCDICSKPITTEFIDGATRMGPWANMCVACHRSVGRGLGTGRGQKYVRDANGQWPKAAG